MGVECEKYNHQLRTPIPHPNSAPQPMTIEQYTPEKFDQLALRVFDLASELREIANGARQAEAENLPVHDKKALLWLDNLEQWAAKTRISFEIMTRKK